MNSAEAYLAMVVIWGAVMFGVGMYFAKRDRVLREKRVAEILKKHPQMKPEERSSATT